MPKKYAPMLPVRLSFNDKDPTVKLAWLNDGEDDFAGGYTELTLDQAIEVRNNLNLFIEFASAEAVKRQARGNITVPSPDAVEQFIAVMCGDDDSCSTTVVTEEPPLHGVSNGPAPVSGW